MKAGVLAAGGSKTLNSTWSVFALLFLQVLIDMVVPRFISHSALPPLNTLFVTVKHGFYIPEAMFSMIIFLWRVCLSLVLNSLIVCSASE